MMTRRELLASFACMALASSVVGEGQPMEQRISIVTLGVKNLAVSRRFYVDGLGWKPVYEDKEIIFFQTGGMVFALFLRDKLAEDFQANPAAFGRAPMALAYNVRTKNEVDPLIGSLRPQAQRFLSQPGKPHGEDIPAILPTRTDSPGRWLGTLIGA
jgi:catechol 2,3-dioxygenase-like lactoylglutathione lyase family enzyme